MNKNRISKESSIPRSQMVNRGRSSSIDCIRRGSYLPTVRRTSSTERCRVSGSAVKQYARSPKLSVANRFAIPWRASSIDAKRFTKDPRPFSDKSYQKRCVCALVEFLNENGFSYNPTSLMSPTKKDVEKIFQFLYNFWDVKYEVRRIEDEAPKLLKSLHYPFTVNKSTFTSITYITWPMILGIFMWLMELNKFVISVNLEAYVGDFDSPSDEQRILLDYILESYESGVDDPEKDNEIFTKLVKNRCSTECSIEELERNLQEKENMLSELNGELEENHNLLKGIEDLENEILSYEDFFLKMENHKKLKESNYENLKKDFEAKEAELNELRNLVSEKEKIYESQGYNGLEAQNYYIVQKDNLLKKLEQKKELFKQEEKAYWELEIQLSQLTDKLETQCHEFNQLYSDLRNDVSTAVASLKNANAPAAAKLYREYKAVLPEFEMQARCYRNCCTTWNEVIKPTLEKEKNYIEEQRKAIHSIASVLEYHIHELELQIADCDRKQQLTTAQSTQKERQMEDKIKGYQVKTSALEKECEVLKQKYDEIHQERLKSEKCIEDLKKSLRKLSDEKRKDKTELKKYKDTASMTLENTEAMFNESMNKAKEMAVKAKAGLDDLLQTMKNFHT